MEYIRMPMHVALFLSIQYVFLLFKWEETQIIIILARQIDDTRK